MGLDLVLEVRATRKHAMVEPFSKGQSSAAGIHPRAICHCGLVWNVFRLHHLSASIPALTPNLMIWGYDSNQPSLFAAAISCDVSAV
jgi:hypothetical protein